MITGLLVNRWLELPLDLAIGVPGRGLADRPGARSGWPLGIDYRQKTMRVLENRSAEAIDRYPFRIAVERYPEDPERNREQYRKYPLTVAESNIRAWQESELYGKQPMDWEVEQDLESFKEIWLLFKNEDRTFPLLPGMSCSIIYEYTVSNKHWGPMVQAEDPHS
jgi:hypothetical protein